MIKSTYYRDRRQKCSYPRPCEFLDRNDAEGRIRYGPQSQELDDISLIIAYSVSYLTSDGEGKLGQGGDHDDTPDALLVIPYRWTAVRVE